MIFGYFVCNWMGDFGGWCCLMTKERAYYISIPWEWIVFLQTPQTPKKDRRSVT